MFKGITGFFEIQLMENNNYKKDTYDQPDYFFIKNFQCLC